MTDKYDGLKYRNEIEVMSRLRGYKVDNLYSDNINNIVESSINDLYEHKHYEVIFTSTDCIQPTNYTVDELAIMCNNVANCNVKFNVASCGADAYYFRRWFESVIRFKDDKFPRVNYKAEAILLQYDKRHNFVKRFKLFEVYPILMDPSFCVDSEYYTFTFESSDIEEWPLNEDKNTRSENIICGNGLYIENKNPIASDVICSQIEWDDYFMNVAILTSLRSKDKNTKVGSVLVDKCNRIIGCGYNGLPSKIDESQFPTVNDKNLPYNETKYAYVIHSEMNALLNCTVYDLSDSKLYVTLLPCCDCVKVLLQKGIKEIIYLSDKHHDDPHYVASRKLLDAANVKYRLYDGKILL